MFQHLGVHKDLHSEQGALRGEHPGRSKDPVIKVRDLAWLEFEARPEAGETFARAFGFTTALRTADEYICAAPTRAHPAWSSAGEVAPDSSGRRSPPGMSPASTASPPPPG